MTITPETVKHVATLARLELTEDETARYTHDLSMIMELVSQLDQLDTSKIENTEGIYPSQDISLEVVYREDTVQKEYTREGLLRNAPETEDQCFRVPQILDKTE